MLLHFMNNSTAVLLVSFRSDQYLEDLTMWVYGAAAILMASVALALHVSRARLAPTVGQVGWPSWEPDYPSAAYPPENVGTRMLKPSPGWAAVALVLVSLGLLASSYYLAKS
jgi:hypothetical protein